MAQIKNKFDIQNSITQEVMTSSRRLPNYFDNSDEITVPLGILLSLLVHACFILILLILSAFGITLSRFDLPVLPDQDIEFKLVQQESKPPIDKNTKIRSDRDSQAGGIHDPKKPISDPTPKGPKTEKPAPSVKPQPQPQKQVKTQPVQQAPKQTVQKPVQQAPKQPVKPQQPAQKPAPAKPSAVTAPNTSLKPNIAPKPQGIAKPSAPKLATAPKSPFAVPVPSGTPSGTTYKPAGTPNIAGAPKGGASGTGTPTPKFSSSGSGSSGSATGIKPSTGGSYGSRGSYGGGSGGNPSPGNPNGTPGIDAIKQPNWGPYMRDLEQRIKRNWTPPKGDSSKRVVITFTISRDGRLLNKRIVKSSGVPLADRAAMSAIEQTAPFRPLPPEFKGQSVPIEFTFDYNVLNSVMR